MTLPDPETEEVNIDEILERLEKLENAQKICEDKINVLENAIDAIEDYIDGEE